MYKTAVEYYKEPVQRTINYSYYQGPQSFEKYKIKKEISKNNNSNKSDETVNYGLAGKGTNQQCSNITWETSKYTNMSDPKVWGPAFWFTLHNGASKYPISASPIVKSRMKSYIIGIPTMLPCTVCQIHATNHIEKNKSKLDEITSGRDNLFKFFVDFHNIVNKRYNKPIVSVEDAYKMYDGGVNVSVMRLS